MKKLLIIIGIAFAIASCNKTNDPTPSGARTSSTKTYTSRYQNLKDSINYLVTNNNQDSLFYGSIGQKYYINNIIVKPNFSKVLLHQDTIEYLTINYTITPNASKTKNSKVFAYIMNASIDSINNPAGAQGLFKDNLGHDTLGIGTGISINYLAGANSYYNVQYYNTNNGFYAYNRKTLYEVQIGVIDSLHNLIESDTLLFYYKSK